MYLSEMQEKTQIKAEFYRPRNTEKVLPSMQKYVVRPRNGIDRSGDRRKPFVRMVIKAGDEMISNRVKIVFEHGQWINGPEVKALEKRVAQYTGRKHAIAVGNGYDALSLAIECFAPIRNTPVIITTPFTFGATASAAIKRNRVKFVDIGDDLQINHAMIDDQFTGAILPVDLFGGTPNYQELKKTGCRIIEDAAQAFGAEYDGRKAGALGDVGCFSFHPSKLLGACGDSGMIVLDDDQRAAEIRMLANHGMSPGTKYLYSEPGVNSRMDSIQAAILLDRLDDFDRLLTERRVIASVYRRALPCVKHPIQEGGIRRPSFSIYPVLFETQKHRQIAQMALTKAGFWSRIYYPIPLHLQPAFNLLGYKKGDFPKAEKAAETILALPMEITMEQIGQVIDIIRGACEA